MRTLARLENGDEERLELNSTQSRWFYLAGICAVLLVLLINLVVIERQEPWEDEVFGVSTGWSLARSQGQTLSVLADYPRTGSPILFYGPVSFYAEAWLIRRLRLVVVCMAFCLFSRPCTMRLRLFGAGQSSWRQ